MASLSFHWPPVTRALIIFWLSAGSWSQSILSCVIIFDCMYAAWPNSVSVCCSVFLFSFFNFQPRDSFSQSHIIFSQFELQHFSQICQQCVLKSLSVGSCSPWTQPSSIFTVWGLTGSKRGPFQHLLTSVPVGLKRCFFHTELMEELHPQRS